MAALCVLFTASTATAGWARYALVIGYNDSDDSDLAALRYADDDAVKYAQLLKVTTKRTVLLTALDADSKRVFGAQNAKAPTRKNVFAALKSLRAQMARDKARGDQPVLFFVYSGHGNYDQEGRGYVHLADGRLTTRDIYYDVLGPTEGETPHHVVLMVDACNAALLVNSRGSDRRKVRRTSLKLEDYPNVGVILSSSSVGEVHEWGKYLSGIFSHEVRSALLGPADLNDDAKVSFAELAAFVATANAEVHNEIYRVKPYIRPPLSAPNMPLMSFADAKFPARVRMEGRFQGKTHLLNSELLRYADFHKSAGHTFWLGVPSSGGFRLVSGKSEYVVPKGAKGDLTLAQLVKTDRTVLAKRGPDEYFEERLFARAQGPAAAREWLRKNYQDSLVVERFERIEWYRNGAAWSLLGSGLGALGGGLAFHVAALNAADEAPVWADDGRFVNERIETNMTAAYAMYGVGGAAAIGSVVWFVLDKRFETTKYRPPLKVNVTPGGVTLSTDF